MDLSSFIESPPKRSLRSNAIRNESVQMSKFNIQES